MKKGWCFFIPAVWMGIAAGIAALFFHIVDLNPVVSDKFFFETDDPVFLENKKISEIFPELSQPIVISARGDIRSDAYADKMKRLTEALEKVPDVLSVHSLTNGPKSVDAMISGPLWQRLLLAKDQKSTNIILATRRGVPPARISADVEAVARPFDSEDFRILISGPPVITNLIQKTLKRDLKIFSTAALIVFASAILLIFRSFPILLGTVAACALSAMATLFITQRLGIPIGPITATLSTITVILSLEHVAYITFNWLHLKRNEPKECETPIPSVVSAARGTLFPSFWSMSTTLLGFASCLFVPAVPLRQLGLSGTIAAAVAFATVYLVYPWFLLPAKRSHSLLKKSAVLFEKIERFFSGKRWQAAAAVLIVAGICGAWAWKINTDPSLLSYFKKGSQVRDGLEYIDTNGGSSPLLVVVRDPEGKKLDSEEAYEKLWKLHEALEKYQPVGGLISQPLIMAEAKNQVPLVGEQVPNDWILMLLDANEGSKMIRYFVTEDRLRSQFFIKMTEGVRGEPRHEVVEKVKEIVRANGFEPELTGGVYILQGKLTWLVIRSLYLSLCLLAVLFFLIGLVISSSLRVAAALFASLLVVPVTILGLIGFTQAPIDLLSAPACNIAVGMGVDAMLHLLIRARRLQKQGMPVWESWIEARLQLWKPILSAGLIVSCGFAIFGLSSFPPTQRFGLEIAFGSVMASLAALLVLPVLAGIPLRKFKK